MLSLVKNLLKYPEIHLSSSELFPSGDSAYRADRNSKIRIGYVFILVRNSLICREQDQFRTNCERVWVKLEVAPNRSAEKQWSDFITT